MKNIYILPLILFIISCGDKVREEITERYDNGSKKLLVRYKGEGVDEIVVERINYSKSGDTLILEKPLDNMTIERKYYTNGNIREEVHYKGGFSYGNRNVRKYWSEDGELLVNDGNGEVSQGMIDLMILPPYEDFNPGDFNRDTYINIVDIKGRKSLFGSSA